MPNHIALLRGINVGKAKRVAMADLRALVESLGCSDVRTLLNSGNVVFATSKPAGLAARIERALVAKTGVSARVTVLSAEELAVVMRENTLLAGEPGTDLPSSLLQGGRTPAKLRERSEEVRSVPSAVPDPSRLLVAVLADPADRPKLVALTKQTWKPDAIAVGTRAAYLWCPGGVIDSKLAAAMAKAMGDGVTSRNWTTMSKLAALADVGP